MRVILTRFNMRLNDAPAEIEELRMSREEVVVLTGNIRREIERERENKRR